MPQHKELIVSDEFVSALRGIPLRRNPFLCIQALSLLVDMNDGDSTRIVTSEFRQTIEEASPEGFAVLVAALPFFVPVEPGFEMEGDVFVHDSGQVDAIKGGNIYYIDDRLGLEILLLSDFEGKGSRMFIDWDFVS